MVVRVGPVVIIGDPAIVRDRPRFGIRREEVAVARAAIISVAAIAEPAETQPVKAEKAHAEAPAAEPWAAHVMAEFAVPEAVADVVVDRVRRQAMDEAMASEAEMPGAE